MPPLCLLVSVSAGLAGAQTDTYRLADALSAAVDMVATADVAERAGDHEEAARILAAACKQYVYSGAVFEPDPCGRAVALGRSIGRPDIEAEALAYRASRSSWTPATWDAAIADGERALELVGDRPGAAGYRWARLALGATFGGRGDAGPALEHLYSGVAASERAGDPEVESLSRALLARTLFWMGDFDTARREATRALEIARASGDLNAEFFAHWELAMTELESGRPEASIAPHEAALALAERLGNGAGAVMMQMNLADGWAELGQTAEADARLRASRTLMARNPGLASWQPYIDETQGRVFFAQGRFLDAAEHFGASAVASDSAWLTVRALLGRARALRAAGLPDDAMAAYEDTIRQVAETRAGAYADAQRASYMAANVRAHHELIALLWDTEGTAQAARAFRIAEMGRARSLLDALRATGLGAGQEGEPLSLPEIQALIQPGQLLVEYVQAERRLFAFVVGADLIEWVDLTPDDGTEGLEGRVRFYRRLVQQADGVALLQSAGTRLFRELVEPALALAHAEIDTLILSPGGVLHYLPFAALVRPSAVTDTGEFLVERLAVAYTPSGSFLSMRTRSESPAPAPLLAVSDPLLETADERLVAALYRSAEALGPLPFSRLETDAAAATVGLGALRLSGIEASEAAVKAAGLERFRILHFATHALIDETLPLRSWLLLGEGDGEDGFLRAEEIYPLSLGADLVILSACQTGAGQVLASEGVQSLARAFLYAGAGAVAATLWEIDDRRSVDVTGLLYDAMAAGHGPVAALAAASRTLIASGAPPRTWGAFVLIGQPNLASPVPLVGRSPPWAWRLLVGLGLLLALALALTWVRRSRT